MALHLGLRRVSNLRCQVDLDWMFIAEEHSAYWCSRQRLRYLLQQGVQLVAASGVVVSDFSVDPHPSFQSLLLLFGWLFFWEIGGQNVPADWNDTVEDLRVGAKTIPIHFGVEKAGLIVLGTLSLTVIISCFLPSISPLPLGIPYIIGTLIIGFFFLLRPAFELYKLKEGRYAGRLFDRASFYPVMQFLLISVFVIANYFIG